MRKQWASVKNVTETQALEEMVSLRRTQRPDVDVRFTLLMEYTCDLARLLCVILVENIFICIMTVSENK